MKYRHSLLVAVVLAIAFPMAIRAQVRNEGLANGMISARKKDASMIQQYNWDCRTEILKDGNLQDLRVNLVSIGPDGEPQRSLLSDQESPLQGGPFRKAIEKNERKQLEEYVKKVRKLVDQYTFSSAGKVGDFMSQAKLQPV